jgi:hypothetical protein
MLVELNPPVDDVRDFCSRCSQLGYNNNSTLLTMKWQWCLDNGGAWWAAYRDDKIVSIAGCHPFRDGYRLVFRGAQTESNQTGLSKHHLSSIPWAVLMPEQIAWCSGVATGETPGYITTNVANDASGKMNRTHRVMNLLATQRIVNYLDTNVVYGAKQSIWTLNVGAYFQTLR